MSSFTEHDMYFGTEVVAKSMVQPVFHAERPTVSSPAENEKIRAKTIEELTYFSRTRPGVELLLRLFERKYAIQTLLEKGISSERKAEHEKRLAGIEHAIELKTEFYDHMSVAMRNAARQVQILVNTFPEGGTVSRAHATAKALRQISKAASAPPRR